MPNERQEFDWSAYAQQVMDACNKIVEALRPVIDQFMEACKKIYAVVKDAYQQAGAPYGDSDDGMLRWVKDMSTIARLRYEANVLEARHRTLAEIRQMKWSTSG